MTSSIETSDAWPFDSPLARKQFARSKWEGRREGRREARAEDILIVLEARGLDVDDAERARIVTSTNLKQLKTWFGRAITAERTSDLFA